MSIRVAGVDEAGRGPLAGPVVCAAVILPEGFTHRLVRDSKALTPSQREEAALFLRETCVWSVESCSVEEVDQLNILWASMEGMRRAVCGLSHAPESALIDGDRIPLGLPCPAQAVVKGDAKHSCISAASILAKTERDRMMIEAAQRYPEYGFDRHFGYATPDHLAALAEYGPCPLHRRSFAPVRDLLNQPCLMLEF